MFNKKRFSVVAITVFLFLVAVVAPLCAARIGNQLPVVPGAPVTALKVDLTNVTPSENAQQVASAETQIFYYKNVTLMLDSTRPLDLDITVNEQVTPQILSLSISPDQDATLTINMNTSPASGQAPAGQALNFYVDITPNATIALQAQMKLNINATTLSQELNREVNPEKLTWMYWDTTQNQWVPVPSFIDEYGYLVCSTTHFSSWTVSEVQSETSPTPSIAPSTTPAPTTTPTPTSTAIPEPTPSQTAADPTVSASPESTIQPTATPNQTPEPTLASSPSAAQAASLEPESGVESASGLGNVFICTVALVVVVAVGTLASLLVVKNRPRKIS